MKRSAWVRLLLVTFVCTAMAHVCMAQFAVSIRVGFAPPPLPVYEQPLCPGDGYIWTPGYWAWDADGDDYYWVPGTWVLAPEVGYLWTPPYWGWGDGAYIFYPGYWGPRVGFYGGIVYGFGYFGRGYEGGRWEGGHFFYNRYVNNINVTEVHNVYETRVEERNVNVTRVSYNGGNGGVSARPTAEEETAMRERHVAATSAQTQHTQEAMRNTQFRASVNRGKPPIAATDRPGEFSGKNVVPARAGGNYTPPPNRGNASAGGGAARNDRPPNAVHPKELPPMEHGTPPNTGNAKQDQKYQQQQAKLYEKQNQDRQKLQQKQDQEHQKFEQQQAKVAKQQMQETQHQQQQQQMQQRQQQMEQRHQQQTQEMQQRHTQQQQQMQQRQAPPPSHQGGGQPHH